MSRVLDENVPPNAGRRIDCTVRWACLVLPFALVGATYESLVHNYFHGDDFVHFLQLFEWPTREWLFTPWAGHLYVFRNAVFSLFDAAFGLQPTYWFAVVLATHLLNVSLVFRVIDAAGGGPWLASLGATLWGVTRANEGALGWYSVYGHVMVPALVLTVFARMTTHARARTPVSTKEAVLWIVLLVLASTSFGVGLGIALVFPLAVLVALRRLLVPPGARRVIAALPVIAVSLWIIAQIVYGPPVAQGPLGTPILTRAWRIAPTIFLNLFGAGITALLDPFADVSRIYPCPLAYVLVAIYLTVLLAGLAVSAPVPRGLIGAALLIAAGCYAMVTLGRAWFFGIPVFGATTPRYHYAALVFLTLALFLAIARLGTHVRLPAPAAGLATVVGLASLLILQRRSGWTIDHHDADRRATEEVLSDVRMAAVQAPPGKVATVQNRPFEPVPLPPPTFAGWAAVFAIFGPHDLVGRVYFADPSGAIRKMARPGGALLRVLLPPPTAERAQQPP